VGNIDLKMISIAENSNRFPKCKFWKEKSVEDMATLGPTTHATKVNINKDENPLTKIQGMSKQM
jgi:hypothetical protein